MLSKDLPKRDIPAGITVINNTLIQRLLNGYFKMTTYHSRVELGFTASSRPLRGFSPGLRGLSPGASFPWFSLVPGLVSAKMVLMVGWQF